MLLTTPTKNNDIIFTFLREQQCESYLIENWREISFSLSDNYKKRIFNWIDFLHTTIHLKKRRSYLFNCDDLFQKCIAALLDLVIDEEWFSQTTYEFELSQIFIDRVLDSENLTYFENKEEALYFLKTSIVFSYYSGFLKTSILSMSRELLPCPTLENQAIFFKNLFSKYDNSCGLVLYKNILHMSLADLKLFMQIINGGSLRKISKLNLYSKKQVHTLLFRLPEFLQIKNGVFTQGWYFSKLLLINDNQQFFMNFYYGLQMDYRKNALLIQDFNYWKNIYQYLAKHDQFINNYNFENRTHISTRDILDFLLHKKHTALKPVFLKGRSITNLIRLVEEWEYFSHIKTLKPKINEFWKVIPEKPWIQKTGEKTYKIIEITNSFSLYEEGNYMKHCVYFYLKDCVGKKLQIFSLQEVKKEKLKRLVTIELRGKNIVQARGKCNRKIRYDERLLLMKWCFDCGYKLLV